MSSSLRAQLVAHLPSVPRPVGKFVVLQEHVAVPPGGNVVASPLAPRLELGARITITTEPEIGERSDLKGSWRRTVCLNGDEGGPVGLQAVEDRGNQPAGVELKREAKRRPVRLPWQGRKQSVEALEVN